MVDTRNYALSQRELQCTNNFNKMLDIPMLLYYIQWFIVLLKISITVTNFSH